MEKEKVRKMAQQMFEKGKSYSEISRKFNISESTLKSWKRRDDWQRATPHKKRSATPSKKKKVAPKGLQSKKSDEEFNRIKNNLLSQLKSKGAHEDAYIDLVNDYMSMWKIKNQLIEDINDRGVQVKTYNSNGQMIYKKNDSIVELPKYNSQMLKLLNDLGLSALEIDNGDDDGDI
ncbi:transposase [Turicibacter sanguinis]|nr:transposase [Turicibacter sanguinis]MTO05225.1 transposase [Turicibacter sanguinis]MTO39419.1 transposase [Turicibacter sanguinis]MTO56460.1 transposase [Turicibacter sanguinis]MTO62205.1 transposase [Turicibacter sanguinis]